MSEQERTYTAAEIRAAIREEFASVFRPSLWMGAIVGGLIGWKGLPAQGLSDGIGSGIAAGILAVLLFFIFGWCYREGDRATSNTPKMVTGPTGELLLQRVLGVVFNFVAGLVMGPVTAVRLLFRLWQLRGR